MDEDFKCKLLTWDYLYDLCRDVSDQVKESGFEPDIVVALARGGWFPGRVVCDFLGMDDLESLKIEHYVGTAETGDEAEIRYPVTPEAVEGKDVLLVDDIVDTGKSLMSAEEHLREEHEPGEVRSAILQYLEGSEAEPDFVGETPDEWAWMVYPWNFVEDMVELVGRCMGEEPLDLDGVKRELKDRFSLDRVWFEVAQPDRLPEVMEEMERRGLVERTEEGWVSA